MNVADLLERFDVIAQAPGGVQKLRELVLTLAVQGKLVAQDPADEPASVLLERIKADKAARLAQGKGKKEKPLAPIADEEKPFELPGGWEWSCLAELGIINPRNYLADHIDVGFVPMSLIASNLGAGHQQEARKWGEVKTGFTHFADGDVGVAKITPCFENGKSCVFSGLTNGVGAGTTELHVFRPLKDTLNPAFILLYLKTPWFLLNGESKMTGSAGQKRLPRAFFELSPFPLPPQSEQSRIVAKVEQLLALIDRLEAAQTRAATCSRALAEATLQSLSN